MSTPAATAQVDGTAESGTGLHYTMLIQWDPNDRIYVVTVPELEGCASHGATYAEAAQQGQDAIETWIATARAYGDPIPPPHVHAWRDDFTAEAAFDLETGTP
jgi:predicted RNase H-like HicB family nuclease